jgi:peptidoglycan hydrolase-like protein with peptidoglycan-binding domain
MKAIQTELAPAIGIPFSSSPTLHPWDRGTAVAEMQELLCVYGFKVRIDGDFGWRTEIAVKQFQKQQKLPIDGVVESNTWTALKRGVKLGDRMLWQGKSGADVVELQNLLQRYGYAVTSHGRFDTVTKRAVMDFQQRHNLNSNGIVGAATQQQLHLSLLQIASLDTPTSQFGH